MIAKRPGKVHFSDNYDSADTVDESGTMVTRCMVRHAKLFILDGNGEENASFNIPYGSTVFVKEDEKSKREYCFDKMGIHTQTLFWQGRLV